MTKDIKFLYRYYPLRPSHKEDMERIVQVVVQNELYFSSYKSLNDPFECAPIYEAPDRDFSGWIKRKALERFRSPSDIETVKHRWETGQVESQVICGQVAETMKREIEQNIGICCFSAQKDNLLMWSHYASGHTGVCFQFETSPFTEFFGEALSVGYQENRPVVNIFHPDDDFNMQQMFLTKNSKWRYEEEFRMIGPHRHPGKAHKFPKYLLRGLIFGAKALQENESLLKDYLKRCYEGRIKLYRAGLSQNNYSLDISEAI